jgi:hypothetical protein
VNEYSMGTALSLRDWIALPHAAEIGFVDDPLPDPITDPVNERLGGSVGS